MVVALQQRPLDLHEIGPAKFEAEVMAAKDRSAKAGLIAAALVDKQLSAMLPEELEAAPHPNADIDAERNRPLGVDIVGEEGAKGRKGKARVAWNLPLGIRAGWAETLGQASRMEHRTVVSIDLAREILQHEQLEIDDNVALFAVYDGYDGSFTAEALSTDLHFTLGKFLTLEYDDVRERWDAAALLASEQVDKALLEKAKQRGMRKSKLSGKSMRADSSGASAAVVVVRQGMVHVMWVGDTRCILCRKGAAHELTSRHHASDEEEHTRILDLGGDVIDGRLFGELLLSRAFGDFPRKMTGALIVQPGTRSEDIVYEDEFILLASDSVFSVLEPQLAINFVRRRLREKRDVQAAARGLLAKCDALGATENMSAVVVALHQQPRVTGDMLRVPDPRPPLLGGKKESAADAQWKFTGN